MPQWTFDDFTFPWEDSPSKGNADDWNLEERLIEHEPLMANVTVLTSWGFRSRTRSITGTCSATTRDTLQAKQLAGTVGALVDSEGRSVTARIIRTKFVTLQPKIAVTDCDGNPADGRYRYTIDIMER